MTDQLAQVNIARLRAPLADPLHGPSQTAFALRVSFPPPVVVATT